MTVASDARAAVREHPFLYDGLRAGIVNYTAAARFLDVGDVETVGAALRRYAEELDDDTASEKRVSVSMRSGVRKTETDDGLLSVGGATFAIDDGAYTGIVATGDLDATTLEAILGRLRTAEIDVVAAAATNGTATLIVERQAGPDAVRAVESVV